MSNENDEQKEKLISFVRDAIEQDKALREQYQIGDKFRFIRDRLQALLTRVEESIASQQQAKKITVVSQLADDEMKIYVYLYNAQGILLQTWQKMLNPTVFYEYSVNRPIYTEKSHIEAFIRSKTNKAQHGYLTIGVKKQDVLKADEIAKDPIGQPLVKVKEGSLRGEKFIAFTHNNEDYELNVAGEIIKKKSF